MTRAVVFAYHDVGVRCLKALRSAGIEVPLVISVADDPSETLWYASVAATARDYGYPLLLPSDANAPDIAGKIGNLAPDLIFSFYYRSLISDAILRHAKLGAFNLHGSLLPRYRGRSPVNWAILRGETTTGVTLHEMVQRADAGAIVDQQSVPILIDDTARDVFAKITVAAEMVVVRTLPELVAGTAAHRVQPVLPGEYFGRRKPEDGRIDWQQSALSIHNLVRAVAPPFPGAFAIIADERWEIHRTHLYTGALASPSNQCAALTAERGQCLIRCADGSQLQLLAAHRSDGSASLTDLIARASRAPIKLV